MNSMLNVCNESSQLREILFPKVDNLEFNLMSNEDRSPLERITYLF